MNSATRILYMLSPTFKFWFLVDLKFVHLVVLPIFLMEGHVLPVRFLFSNNAFARLHISSWLYTLHLSIMCSIDSVAFLSHWPQVACVPSLGCGSLSVRTSDYCKRRPSETGSRSHLWTLILFLITTTTLGMSLPQNTRVVLANALRIVTFWLIQTI